VLAIFGEVWGLHYGEMSPSLAFIGQVTNRAKKAFARQGREGTSVAFISGAFSGTLAALITSPFDVLKTRRQAFVMSSRHAPLPIFPFLIQIIRTEGSSALFAGIAPRMAKIAPACGIMIACYEGIGKLLTYK